MSEARSFKPFPDVIGHYQLIEPLMPEDPEISEDGLKPYLGGWSPYGPQRW